jgi:predicted dienelactone hydrolase
MSAARSAAATVVIGFACFALAFAGPASGPATRLAAQPGQRVVLHDAKRNKELPLTLFIPDSPGPHPLIVFSHGAGGAGDYYRPLVGGWVTSGYVVICPTHADSIALMTPQKRRELRPRDVVLDAVSDVQGWQERPRDVSFVLDSLDELERRVPQLAGKIDRTRIGAAGHSYGAMTTTILAGASIRTKIGGDLISLADPRVKAAIVLSGQGEGQMGFGEGSWTGLKIPLLVMTGSKDRGARGQDPKWRKAPFANSPAGQKYWVFIDGATHMSFSGRDSNNAILGVIERSTQTFWDAQLKGDEQAMQLLHSGKVAKDAGVDVDYETR